MSDPNKHPLNIAIIGTGIAGLSAAWLLQKAHRITVFEKNDWIGGHSHTVDAATDLGRTAVDTGFIVYNERNYPNLTALFEHLRVPTKPSDMSFSASLRAGSFEYAGTNLNGLLGQRSNLAKPRFWRMMRDIFRFYREAPDLLNDDTDFEGSLGEYLCAGRYGESFIHDHLLPMGAAIWSTTATEMLNFPASVFIRFFQSHGLLSVANRPQWRTVDGGSREYVDRLVAPFRDRIRWKAARKIRRMENGVQVTDQQGVARYFDHVVIAAHADEALCLLVDADPKERDILGSWRYTENRAVLHRDTTLMPRRRRVWSSWNFIEGNAQNGNALCVTYWMNRLQTLDPRTDLFLTLNPPHEPADGTKIGEFTYTHPLFDHVAVKAQRALWSLQGHRRSWYCGSYFGYGFHEDALQSGLAVAERLGNVRRPWTVNPESDRIQINATIRGIAA